MCVSQKEREREGGGRGGRDREIDRDRDNAGGYAAMRLCGYEVGRWVCVCVRL